MAKQQNLNFCDKGAKYPPLIWNSDSGRGTQGKLFERQANAFTTNKNIINGSQPNHLWSVCVRQAALVSENAMMQIVWILIVGEHHPAPPTAMQKTDHGKINRLQADGVRCSTLLQSIMFPLNALQLCFAKKAHKSTLNSPSVTWITVLFDCPKWSWDDSNAAIMAYHNG